MNDYKFGYIGTLDILGFGNYCYNKNNFSILKSLMDDLYAIKKTYEYNFKENICIMSDTIIIMVEIKDNQKYDTAYFDSLVEWIAMLMITIRHRIGLFCRGSITIGNYYFNNERNILFGPGVVRGVTLAEKINSVNEIQAVNSKLIKRPAALIIDNEFFDYPDDSVKRLLFENMTTESVKNSQKYISVGANYYIYNTYYSEYNYYVLSNEDPNALESFIKEAEERIEKQSNIPGFEEKYYFEKSCLDSFIKNKRVDS